MDNDPKLSIVSIIPTGLGCKHGGDTGWSVGAKLIGACCDNLILNPNHVNSSDINEMPDNSWYTEGSIIDDMLEGRIKLKRPKGFNKILLVVNPPTVPDNWNAMNASIYSMGADIELLELKTPLIMKAIINPNGSAGGEFSGADELVEQVKHYDFDVLAIHTSISCDDGLANSYFSIAGNSMVNPWGGIEAIVSKYIASKLGKNIAHSPAELQTSIGIMNIFHTTIVPKSMAAEAISNTNAHCMFKGLHKAPVISNSGLGVEDISFLVTPHGCWGRPHQACRNNRIPIIVVKDNTTIFSKDWKYPEGENGLIFVENYLEVAGVIMSFRAGVDYRIVRADK